jgi:hypothetical protein
VAEVPIESWHPEKKFVGPIAAFLRSSAMRRQGSVFKERVKGRTPALPQLEPAVGSSATKIAVRMML